MKMLLLLLIAILVPHTSPQTPVRDHELFVPFANTVSLGVNNITHFSAELHWNLPVETREKLKAMRVNCTALKSLIEPYDNIAPRINLYNPSVVGSRITLRDLQPATKYSCRLVGAMSLNVGREKLAILSDVATFTTLLEGGGEYPRGSEINHTSIIVGATVPVIVIVLACISMLVGYHFYRKSKTPAGGGDKNKKYRMHISKDRGSKPGPSSSGGKTSKSGERSSKHGSKKSKKDRSDKPRKETSNRTGAKSGDKSEHRRVKKEKPRKDKKNYVKLDGASTRKSSKKAAKKKSLDVYAYDELLVHSSEDNLYGYKDEVNLELEADLGWDPTTYYPLPRKMYELSSPIQAIKAIELRDLSSPAVLGHNNDIDAAKDDEPYSYTKGEYYRPHQSIQPLY